MNSPTRFAPLLGEVVAAAFDCARDYSDDPREVAKLAAGAVNQLLRRRRPRRAASQPRRRDSLPAPLNASAPLPAASSARAAARPTQLSEATPRHTRK